MIYVKTYDEPEVNIKEIQRYAGCRGGCADEIAACVLEISGRLSCRVCYSVLDISHELVSEWLLESGSLCRNLQGCEKILLYAATVGLELDRVISKYSRISPSKALFFQAIGAERIEAVCDMFNDEIRCSLSKQGLYLRPRFSPGYGDFPLEAQRDIFRLLDCSRKIGVTLNDSLLMSPSKSVTAVIGISDVEGGGVSGCGVCDKRDCKFRR